MTTDTSNLQFETLLAFLKESRGFDFTAYKRSTLERRVRKRMDAVKVEDYGSYADYLQVHPDEFGILFNTILINVTDFFRDRQAWDFLATQIIPRIIRSKPEDAPIRVWSAGCSSGEEAYTIAMLLAEALEPEAFRERVKIYATDIDEEALLTARQGTYPQKEVQNVPPDLRQKYFEPLRASFSFRKDYRRVIIFGRHDLLRDAPISRIDLLISRNTLMYFNSEAQSGILSRFYYSLNNGGFLFLGKAETLQSHSQPFVPVDLKFRVFNKSSDVLLDPEPSVSLPANFGANGPSRDQLRSLALQIDPVAQIVVDANQNLILMNERARDIFGLSVTDVGRPLRELDVSYRPVELRSLINQVAADHEPVVHSDVPFPDSSAVPRWFDVQLTPLLDRETSLVGVKITFLDVTRLHEMADELQKSTTDLESAYEELQSSNEELETTNEELQSTVEELETTNEELQSTNEELETMNEELQSTNEELEALNDELRERGTELNQTNVYLESILTSLTMAVIVVDHLLNIQLWSRQAEELWGLRATETIGTPLLNLDVGFDPSLLRDAIRDCINGRSTGYETTLQSTNRRGRSIACRVNVTPFKSRDANDRLGAVLLMEEVEAAPPPQQK